MQLARDVTRDADACSSSASIGHGSGDLRSSVVHGGDGAGGRRAAGRVGTIGVADAEILDKAGEGHDWNWRMGVEDVGNQLVNHVASCESGSGMRGVEKGLGAKERCRQLM